MRGRAIRPVRADSKMPKSEISRRNESMRDGLADLGVCGEGGLISRERWAVEDKTVGRDVRK